MIIQPNTLLLPTTKILRFYDSCVIVQEGPNMLGKLGLANLQIQLDQKFGELNNAISRLR